ncbi:MAG TPA: 23S rRNA (adenine(2503)-C(2))-methyltransferase RlmN [Nitrospiraceae bacterium]|nr:23S rRNA (adenine(2503)-C(2))-methyltransferase RlmN [Nitrospiraceae bacterium]
MTPALQESAEPPDLLSLSEPAMVQFVRGLGWPAYRARQVLRWLYRRRQTDIAGMTDLSRTDRDRLSAHTVISRPRNVRIYTSADGTRKLVFTLSDGLAVESVLIPEDDRLTLCLSTQVGCTLDCAFCLTGTMGLHRNLRVAEILVQVLIAQDHCSEKTPVTNLVFMGMGEPLANLDPLVEAIKRLTNTTWGFGFSPRRITVSTAGLASRLNTLAPLGVNLAVSLNATTEALRGRLMPAAARLHSLRSLLTACRAYPLASHRRLTFEYVLLGEINDAPDDARRLVSLLRGLRSKVNLIPFNPFPGSSFRRPSDDAVHSFQEILRQAGLDTFIRKSRGRDVLGACGQLGQLPATGPVTLTQIEARC